MSLFDGMKDRLGFGTRPEWQEDGYEDYADEAYDDDGVYDDGYDSYADDGYIEDDYDEPPASPGGGVVSFDAYNPSNFEHVTLASDRQPQVASYDNLGTTRNVGNVRPLGPRSSSSRNTSSFTSARSSSGPTWATPDDPSFLDNRYSSTRDDFSSRSSSDPYSSLGSDFLNVVKDPSTHLEIVRPKSYSDVEKVANASKAGKTVVLVVAETKPALAKRILDFSFGVASALNMNVDKADDRVFVISKGTEMLTEAERSYLEKKGILK